jgi:hypothetical protein
MVIAISENDGQPECASTIVGIVVISNNSMIRGFVSAMYAPTRPREDFWAADEEP